MFGIDRSSIMMRLNFKTILLVLVVATLSSLLTSWNNCGNNLLFHTADWKAKYQHKVKQNKVSSLQICFMFQYITLITDFIGILLHIAYVSQLFP